MSQFQSKMRQEFNKLNPIEKKIVNEVWDHRMHFYQVAC